MKFDNKEIEFSVNFAKAMIDERGRVSPMAIGIAGGKRYVAPCMWNSDKGKSYISGKIKEMFRENGVTEIVFMSEAWMKVMDIEEMKRYKSEDDMPQPSKCPDRVECVLITYLSKNENVSATMNIVREDGKVSLGPVKIGIGNDFKDRLWGNYFMKEGE